VGDFITGVALEAPLIELQLAEFWHVRDRGFRDHFGAEVVAIVRLIILVVRFETETDSKLSKCRGLWSEIVTVVETKRTSFVCVKDRTFEIWLPTGVLPLPEQDELWFQGRSPRKMCGREPRITSNFIACFCFEMERHARGFLAVFSWDGCEQHTLQQYSIHSMIELI
jgi:hypothetical protein